MCSSIHLLIPIDSKTGVSLGRNAGGVPQLDHHAVACKQGTHVGRLATVYLQLPGQVYRMDGEAAPGGNPSRRGLYSAIERTER